MADTSFFILKNTKAFILILVYINDIIIASNNDSYTATLIYELKVEFSLKDIVNIHFFLRINVKRDVA